MRSQSQRREQNHEAFLCEASVCPARRGQLRRQLSLPRAPSPAPTPTTTCKTRSCRAARWWATSSFPPVRHALCPTPPSPATSQSRETLSAARNDRAERERERAASLSVELPGVIKGNLAITGSAGTAYHGFFAFYPLRPRARSTATSATPATRHRSTSASRSDGPRQLQPQRKHERAPDPPSLTVVGNSNIS